MESEQKTNKVCANKIVQRYVRVGETDVKVYECWWWPSEPGVMGRHWFDTDDGIQAATYREMCQKLCGRPKPRLPEDEFRFPVGVNGGATQNETNTSNPETGCPAIAENASDPAHPAPADASNTSTSFTATPSPRAAKSFPNPAVWEPFDHRKPVETYPWALDERDPEELSRDEVSMQLVWTVEQIRNDEPDLYAAALDSVKRQEWLDRQAQRKKLEADLAPRCQYIKSDGEPCGGPAIKKRRFCHFHISTSEERRKSKEFQLPALEDDRAIQMAVTNVCRGLLKGKLEPKYASTVLYGLQVASVAVRKVAAAKSRAQK